MQDMEVIVHPTDFSDASRTAFEYALGLARRRGATLHLVHVTGGMGEDPVRSAFELSVDEEAFYTALDEQANQKMSALVREAIAGDVTVRRAHVHDNDPVDAVCTYAASHEADLVVMGTRGRRGVSRWLLGSVAEEVVRESPCAVLTLRSDCIDHPDDVERILIPVDLSVYSRRLVREGSRLAATLGASVDLLHVVEPLPLTIPLLGAVSLDDLIPRPTDTAQAHVEALAREVSVPVRSHVMEGHAAMTILDAAEALASDLIVMASNGLSGLERVMLGSVTARVLRRASTPLLTFRATEQWDDGALVVPDEEGRSSNASS